MFSPLDLGGDLADLSLGVCRIGGNVMKLFVLLAVIIASPALAEDFIAVPDSGWISLSGSWDECDGDVCIRVVEHPPSVVIENGSGSFVHWRPPLANRSVEGLYSDEQMAPIHERLAASNTLKQTIAQARSGADPGSQQELDQLKLAIDTLIENRLSLGDSLILSVDVVSRGNGEVFMVHWRDGSELLQFGRSSSVPQSPLEVQIRALKVYAQCLVDRLNLGAVLFLLESTEWAQPMPRVYVRNARLVVEDVERIRAGGKPIHNILDAETIATFKR